MVGHGSLEAGILVRIQVPQHPSTTEKYCISNVGYIREDFFIKTREWSDDIDVLKESFYQI